MQRKQVFRVLFILFYLLVFLVYLAWRAVFTLPVQFGIFSLVAGITLLVAELVGFMESSMFYATVYDTRTPSTPAVEGKEFPDVDVLIATYNEPLEVLYKTIVGCLNMEYPYKEKVHIYVCDDGRRESLARMCARLKVNYLTRADNVHAKAGNLNNALNKTDSPYIVTFDADMIPMHDFLTSTIPFFLNEESIGFVQTPQSFYNVDPFQHNLFAEQMLPNEQELFSRVIQAGKYRWNAVIYAGSNTVISRKALQAIGGFIVGTITEDFATGMLIQSHGYKCIYLNEVHASGLSPEGLEDLYNQRIRWGRGCVQTFKQFPPLFIKGLSIKQKLMYISAVAYWYFGIWRFIFFMAPILYTVLGIVVLTAPLAAILTVWLPFFLLSQLIFKYFIRGSRSAMWSGIYDTIMFPSVIAGVIRETFGLHLKTFKVTPKDKVTRLHFVNKLKNVRLQIILAALSALGIARVIYMWLTSPFNSGYVINLFWLSYNFSLLLLSIFFASERPRFRLSERILIKTPATISYGERIIEGVTNDISETGVSLLLNKPLYLDPQEEYLLTIKTDRYESRFPAEIIHVGKDNDKYRYAFRISHINEGNNKQLLHILYDRTPLPPVKSKVSLVPETILHNFLSRRKTFRAMERRLPRIPVNRSLEAFSENGRLSVILWDFNYRFCAVKVDNPPEHMTIWLSQEPAYYLDLEHDRPLRQGGNRELNIYRVVNYQDFIADVTLVDLLQAQPADAMSARESRTAAGLAAAQAPSIVGK